ncbi:D-amino-acid transaminase [Caldibacillus thermoamylovorans]|uniref:D-amino-acid transaminase n=1 Tax=Caldibacillus thermoamylovorans TaxID=35841 RepID=UPI001D08C6D8|nr:D-amino-acid transaminase [Caldibacillus thermoamylovorans]MCB5934913.1 D-amino-acid transaminase [Bacillus sp. DFI.2.34]MCB7077900.1 D-amino-acid transaminase [Caldibacillus thermoamylovorans]
MGKVIFNGHIVDREKAIIHIEDRGFQFGDGVYEVIRIYNGKPFTLKEHIDRLYASAQKIYMEIPYSKQEITDLIINLLEQENASTCNLYLQISRGVVPRNHVIPETVSPTLISYLMPGTRPVDLMKTGGKAVITEDLRWHYCDIKSISLLGAVLAKKKATDAGCLEAILHRDGIITEGSSTNIWMVQNGKLFTHPANQFILNGITRQKVISLLDFNQLPYEETGFTVEQLQNADELFLTSTTMEIIPIVEVDGVKIGNGTPGDVTRKLQTLFEQEIEHECGHLLSKVE